MVGTEGGEAQLCWCANCAWDRAAEWLDEQQDQGAFVNFLQPIAALDGQSGCGE